MRLFINVTIVIFLLPDLFDVVQEFELLLKRMADHKTFYTSRWGSGLQRMRASPKGNANWMPSKHASIGIPTMYFYHSAHEKGANLASGVA